MSDRLKELQKKKLVQEYEYTKSELEYRKSVMDENTKEFLEVAYKAAGKERIISDDDNVSENQRREEKLREEKQELLDIDPYIKQKSKKLYREISKRTHPDKDPNGIYTDLFKEATQSYERYRLLDLYHHCERLGIPYDIEGRDIEELNREIKTNRSEIELIEKTFVYLWSIQPSDKMKSIIINQFVRLMNDKM
jgi:hypothetical protein